MSGVEPFYVPAQKFGGEAVALDEAAKYEEAIAKYESAVQYLIQGIQFDKFESRRAQMEAQADSYLKRMTALKEALRSSPAAGGGAGGATAAKKPGDPPSDDAEATKLKAALAGAIVSEKPNVSWNDVAGLEGAKEALKEAVILPVKFPQLFVGSRKPWKGILLYGPPGTGKSYLAKAVATEAAGTFFSVSSSDLMSKWQGESEKLVKYLFELAKAKKPAVIFIDEVDAICGARGEGTEGEASRRVKNEFLLQMQGVGSNLDGVLVLAATNMPWEIDAAMRRRFEKRIYIPLPEAFSRAKMFKLHLGSTPHTLNDGDFGELGARSEGMSGSDISIVVREALMEPLRVCRQARYWRPADAAARQWVPVDPEADPPCSFCTPDLPSKPAPHRVPCKRCGCARLDLMELGSDELIVPPISRADFDRIMPRARSSVAGGELARYEEWTKQFGSEGS